MAFWTLRGSVDRDYERDAARADISKLLEQLPPQLRRIVRLRMQGCPFEEIAGEFGVSRERLRQLEAEAMKKMRAWTQHTPSSRRAALTSRGGEEGSMMA